MKKKITIVFVVILSVVVLSSAAISHLRRHEQTSGTAFTVEKLDRGVYAFCSEEGVYLSWRICADDAADTRFRIYRDSKLLLESGTGDPCCFLDAQGDPAASYRFETVTDGVVSSEAVTLLGQDGYFDIPLDSPGEGYMPGDCSAADADGDGCYELFLKWEARSLDNSQDGITDPTYVDCIKTDGTRLWRIDLGRNIRSGQHYTPMSAADFDCDGYAELIMKTADGTVDGTGQVIGDPDASYINEKGRILEGREYLTLFDGLRGEALDTMNYPVERGGISFWGDDYGNRCDRFNAGAAYLDGIHPSAVFERGYYTRLTVAAVDVVNKKLSVRWIFDTGNNELDPAYGCGSHSIMAADVDGDEKQEICLGASCIDDDGTLLWSNGRGHGDALHVGCFLEGSNEIQVFSCFENAPYGVSLTDGKTGKSIFDITGTQDTGRCSADDLLSSDPGSEFLMGGDSGLYGSSGEQIGELDIGRNFLIYWDSDVQRELLDDIQIEKPNSIGNLQTLLTADGCISNNGTKQTPCLTADILGDWREELILSLADGSALRVWCTTIPTDTSMVTLMQDPQYRMQVACQQSGYNQPPHVGFNMSDEVCRSCRSKVTVLTPAS